MKTRKIRGHRKIHREINQWRKNNLTWNLDEYLKVTFYNYVKIRVSPFCNLSLTKSVIPEPKGKTKRLILKSLIDIYINWENQLEKIGQPYYLKIWIFEPQFSMSQVVCAIEDRIEFYNDSFNISDDNDTFDFLKFGKENKNELVKINWKAHLYEDVYSDDEVGKVTDYASEKDYIESLRMYNKLLKKKHLIIEKENYEGEIEKLHIFKKGKIWVGGR